MGFYHGELFSTYSIVARDPVTGQLGVAVQTHQMSVGTLVPWLLPGVGAVATQALVNVSYGPMGLAMLREGVPAPKVVEALVASDEGAPSRQVAVVDSQARVGAWTGDNCIAEAGHIIGEGYSVQANMMVHDTVVEAMSRAYEQATGNLAGRMMAALYAAQGEGGDIRGMQSAALRIVDGLLAEEKNIPDWKTSYDLRVDEHKGPLTELGRLVRLRSAEILDWQGNQALEKGQRELALETWEQARSMAPELEELSFWQAVTLADEHADIQTAVKILAPMLAEDERREHWVDLIKRIQDCGIIKRQGAGDELITALG
jgi:uncharacterized Ntn-hydrolase superfamily protein